MAISTALDIAARALMAQQAGLAVVGNNIANVNTPGYARQVPVLEEDQSLPIDSGVNGGSGVRVLRIDQVVDTLLERRRTQAQTDVGYQTARRDKLSDLVDATNDLDQTQLGAALNAFFDGADSLSLRPASLVDRQTLLARAGTLASGFNQRYDAIAGVQRAADAKIVDLATRANTAIETIARANEGIARLASTGEQPNDLLDQRQTALNELSSILGVSTTVDQYGQVRVAGDSGVVLVEGGTVVNRLTTVTGAVGLDSNDLHDIVFTNTSNGQTHALPDSLQRGQLGGLFQVRDGDTITAASNLDVLAAGLRDAVNAVQTAGIDLAGSPTTTTPLFSGSGITGASQTIAVAITDPRAIATALPTEGATTGNGNALALSLIRTTPLTALGNLTPNGYLSTETGRLGEAASEVTNRASAATTFADSLEQQRASVSGVNLNEELTNLLRYQHAFQAASQVISVVNTTLDALLQIL